MKSVMKNRRGVRGLLPLVAIAGSVIGCDGKAGDATWRDPDAAAGEAGTDGVSPTHSQSMESLVDGGASPAATSTGVVDDGAPSNGAPPPAPPSGPSMPTASMPEASSPTPSNSPAPDAGPPNSDAGDAELPSTPSPTATTAEPSDGSAPVDLSDLLVPAQGVLLGAYYGDRNIADTSAAIGRTLPLQLTYYAWTDDWVNEGNTRDDLAGDRTPFVNWELYEGGDLQQIIAGDFDDMLAERAADAASLDAKLFVDLGAEMNGDWSPWSGAQNGESADSYVAMYRHVHDAFADAKNVIWVWCPNVTDEPAEDWNTALSYYPGDDYVDWTCVDGYNWGDTNGGSWESFQEIFSNIYPELAQKQKPILIGEMASAESGGDKAQWIDRIVPTLQNDYPEIKALIWFDVDKETDWRIGSSMEAEAAFERMANDPYMNP